LAYATGVSSILLLLLPGSRSGIVQAAFVYIGISHYLGRRRPLTQMVLLAGLALVALVTFAFATRNEAEFFSGRVLANVFNTEQITQANVLHIIDERGMQGDLGGRSVPAALLSPVPGALLGLVGLQKERGANSYLTARVWPRRWYESGAQIPVGGMGSALLNFGPWAVVGIFFALGLGLRVLYRVTNPFHMATEARAMIYVALVWVAFNVIRDDFFHAMGRLTETLAALTLILSWRFVRELMPARPEGSRGAP
jgi:hypothetical protein